MAGIVAINEVIELNHILQEKGLAFKVHLHDACGNQSFSVEAFSESSNVELAEMNQVITEFFDGKRIRIRFTEDGLHFRSV